MGKRLIINEIFDGAKRTCLVDRLVEMSNCRLFYGTIVTFTIIGDRDGGQDNDKN